MMKMYVCPKAMCALYNSCTLSRMIPATEQSDPDGDTGEILYFAACPELGETFCDLHEDSLVEVSNMQSGRYGEEDAQGAFYVMNQMLENAIEYLDFPISHGVVKHGPTKWNVPREQIDRIKSIVPHQAEEIETTFAKIAEMGFEPHEFLEPGEAFMDTALRPFTEEFFGYRKQTGDYYYADRAAQDEINGNKAKYRVAWDKLMHVLDECLPAKPSVVRAQSTLNGLLQLFEHRLAIGVDAVAQGDYNHALVLLKEKLCDVAADLRELNLIRKNEAETKRQAKAAKRQRLQLGSGMQDVAKMDDEHVKRCNWIFKALEEYRCQLKNQLADKRDKGPRISPPTEEWITSYINKVIFGLKRNKAGDFEDAERDGEVVHPITKRKVRTTLQQALGATINDIKHIYMNWREEKIREIHHTVIKSEKDFVANKEIDLAAGEHNWGGIEDEEAEFNKNIRMTIGKPKSRWMKNSTASYKKLKKALESKDYRFDYRIFIYWVGLHMEEFVKIPKMMSFKGMFGKVKDVESIIDMMVRFLK